MSGLVTSRPQTFGERWCARQTRGFDYLRIILAVAVVVIHSFEVAYGPDALTGFDSRIPWMFMGFVLPSFFALSGFLVASSLERCRTLEGFMALRVLRLVPALAVEVLLCALLLGPLVTQITLSEYLRDPLFFKYFQNILGEVQFHLPGVFAGNPVPGMVNKSLWTVPYELKCYIALLVLAAVGLFRRRFLFLMAVVALIPLVPLLDLKEGHFFRPHGVVPGRVLVAAFLAGICCYLYKDRIRRDGRLFLIALVLALVTLSAPELQYLCTFPIAYVTVWLGLTNPPRSALLSRGDYSYGVYLFAYPLQQVVARWEWTQAWWINAALVLPLSFAYAAFSWHAVEAPFLRQKRQVVEQVERLGEVIRALIRPRIFRG